MATPASTASAFDARGVAISTRGLEFGYDTPAGRLRVLDHLDCDIAPGSVVAITGASGSGKTTLLSVLGGLDQPQAGSVRVGGVDLAQLRRDDMAKYRRDVVGFVFQDFGLLGQLTALENVELALTFGRAARRHRRDRARQLLTAVGLSDRLSHRPNALSGGEKQRVAIARALANEPRLVLADEPTGNLDAGSARDVLTLLQKLNKDFGKTIVMVTHDPHSAAAATRLIHLDKGQFVEAPNVTAAV